MQLRMMFVCVLMGIFLFGKPAMAASAKPETAAATTAAHKLNSLDEEGLSPLMRAVLDGQLDSVKQLIAQGADINLENPAGWNALLMSPTPEMAKLLIEQGADIHASSQNGFNSLLVAAKLGDLALISFLLEKNIDINASNQYGWTALMVAVEFGHQQAIFLLLENGANLKQKNNGGWGLPEIAAHNNHLDIFKSLLNKTGQVLSKEYAEEISIIALKNGATEILDYLVKQQRVTLGNKEQMLKTAVSAGSLASVKYLVSKGADINALLVINAERSSTPLMISANRGDLDIVKYLLDKGAKLETQDTDGVTALAYSVRDDNLEVVRYLVAKGANLNVKGSYKETLMHQLVGTDDAKVFNYLVESGADINQTNDSGNSPLYYAAWFGRLDYVTTLVRHGANITKQDIERAVMSSQLEITRQLLDNAPPGLLTAETLVELLYSAAGKESVEMVKLLVERGANINGHSGSRQETALMAASMYRHLDTVKYLIGINVDVNARDSDGRPALMYAANPIQGAGEKSNLEVVKALVESKADLTLVSHSGETMLEQMVRTSDIQDFNYVLSKLGADILPQGHKALKRAISYQKQEFIDSLSQYGIKPPVEK